MCYGLRADALAGGSWGFGGGVALGLLYADGRLGPLAVGGLLAGAVPAALKRLLFWQYGAGQAALGALAGLLGGVAPLVLVALRGDLAVPLASLLLRAALDGLMTGAVVPLLFRLTARRGRARPAATR